MKLIASDFDGTVKSDPEGLKKDINAILKWKSAGNIFAVCSGRNAPQIRDIIARLGIPADYVLGDSGNSCYKSGKIEYASSARGDILKELYDFLISKNAYYIVVNCPEKATVVYREKDGCIVCNDFGKIDDFSSFTQVSAILGSTRECHLCANELNRRFDGLLTGLPNDECLDIVPYGRTKAECVKYLSEYLGIHKDNVYTVGDNHNDIQMLKAFRSFAVSNAPDDVKSTATLGVTDSVADMINTLLDEQHGTVPKI